MAWQLIYTSAPRLLDAGRSGFGTIARHRDIPSLLVQAVERVSQFARLPGMNPDRVIYSHRVIQISSSRYHVLSMIRSAGADYTGRTNHIAHHLIATNREATECAAAGITPADILLKYSWLAGWTEPPRSLGAPEEVHLAGVPAYPLPDSVWAPLTGNPDHAWLLITHPAGRGCYVKAASGIDFRLIFLESLRGMAGSAWQPTFITSLETTDEAGDFRWIALEEGSPPAATAENSGRIILDLTRPATLPKPEVPQQAAASPATTAPSGPSVVHLQRSDAKPSSTRHATPFVEREDMPQVKKQRGLGSSPWDQPAGTKPTRTSSPKSNNFPYIIAGAAAALILVMGLIHSNHKQNKIDAVAQEKAKEQAALQAKNDRKATIRKSLQGDPTKSSTIDIFFDDSTITEIEETREPVEVIEKFCTTAKELVEAYKAAEFQKPIDLTASTPSITIIRLKRLQEHRNELRDLLSNIFKTEIPDKPIEAVNLKKTIDAEIKRYVATIDAATKKFLVDLSNATNAAIPDGWVPDKATIEKTISESINAKFISRLKDQLHALTDSTDKPAVVAKEWRNALTNAGISISDIEVLLTPMTEKLKTPPQLEITMRAVEGKKPETNIPNNNAPVKPEPKVMYWFVDQLEKLHIPIPHPFDIGVKIGNNSERKPLIENKIEVGAYAFNAIDPALFKISDGHLEATTDAKKNSDLTVAGQLVFDYKVMTHNSDSPDLIRTYVFFIGSQYNVVNSPLIAEYAEVTMRSGGKLESNILKRIDPSNSDLKLVIKITSGSDISKHLQGRLLNITRRENEWTLENTDGAKPAPINNRELVQTILTQVKTIMKPLPIVENYKKVEDKKQDEKNSAKIKAQKEELEKQTKIQGDNLQALIKDLKENRERYRLLLVKENCDRLITEAENISKKDNTRAKDWMNDWIRKTETNETTLNAANKANIAAAQKIADHPLLGGSNRDAPEETAKLYGSVPETGGSPKAQPREILICELKIKFK